MNISYYQNYFFPNVFAGPVTANHINPSVNEHGFTGFQGIQYNDVMSSQYVIMSDQSHTTYAPDPYAILKQKGSENRLHKTHGCDDFVKRELTSEEIQDTRTSSGRRDSLEPEWPTGNSTTDCERQRNYRGGRERKQLHVSLQQPTSLHQLRLPTITVTPNMAENVMSEECDLGYCSFTDLSPLPDLPDGSDDTSLNELWEAQSAFSDMIDDVLESMNSSDGNEQHRLSGHRVKTEVTEEFHIPPTPEEVNTQGNSYGLDSKTVSPDLAWTTDSTLLPLNVPCHRYPEVTVTKAKFSCDICGKLFPSQSSLKYHLRVHKAARPHQCPYCDKAFSQKSTLRTHIRTHTGEKPYGCQYCARAFSDYSTYRKHVRIHTGEKPYTCEICQKSFTQSGNMIRHREMHNRPKRPKQGVTNRDNHIAYAS